MAVGPSEAFVFAQLTEVGTRVLTSGGGPVVEGDVYPGGISQTRRPVVDTLTSSRVGSCTSR